MLRHVVMMQLSAQATEGDLESIVEGLRGLPAVVPEIRSYSVGVDAGIVDGNYDLVVVGDFDDVDGFEAYGANSDHQAVINERIRPFMAARSAVQYVLD